MPKVCEHDVCRSGAVYNYLGIKKGRFCKTHSLKGMINVVSPNCEAEGCRSRPVFNYFGIKKGRFCKKHSLEGMIDVLNRTCEAEGCRSHALYNDPGLSKGRFCKKHSLKGMMNVVNRCCESEKCSSQPVYNVRGLRKGRFCKTHKLEGMIDVVNRCCEAEGCDNWGNPKYDFYCTHCFVNLFKNDPRVANMRRKSKENAWVNAIILEYPDLDWIWNKPFYVDFNGGCCVTKRRIDLRVLVTISTGMFMLCIEIDENQHRSYATTDEVIRYNDLFMDFSGRYVFIRINPDPFRRNGVRMDPPMEYRINIVTDTIRERLTHGLKESESLVEIEHLFFDDV